ncbi:hypothetical protein ACLOJK_027865 [Asimina triloba]
MISRRAYSTSCSLPTSLALQRMADEISSNSSKARVAGSSSTARSLWPTLLRWIPTSTDRIIESEKRLLSLVKYAVLFPP